MAAEQDNREWTGLLLLIIFGIGSLFTTPCSHSQEVLAIRGPARERLERELVAQRKLHGNDADVVQMIEEALRKKERIR